MNWRMIIFLGTGWWLFIRWIGKRENLHRKPWFLASHIGFSGSHFPIIQFYNSWLLLKGHILLVSLRRPRGQLGINEKIQEVMEKSCHKRWIFQQNICFIGVEASRVTKKGGTIEILTTLNPY
jgi:hypothetical protein